MRELRIEVNLDTNLDLPDWELELMIGNAIRSGLRRQVINPDKLELVIQGIKVKH